MAEGVSNLFQVTVSGPGASAWKVLVRAVDAESAAGAVRARGHRVVGVCLGTMPARARALARVSCVSCGYSLLKLPAGEAGEVMCPECGVINTSELPASATVVDEIRARGGNRWRVAVLLLFVLFLIVVFVGSGGLKAILSWIGMNV